MVFRASLLLPLVLALVLSGCATPPYSPAPGPAPSTGGERPVPGQPGAGAELPVPIPVPTPAPVPPPPPKSYRLGTATNALVTQARGATARGDFDAAAATLERALRIEPDNPLVWIEMGRTRLAGGDARQAENMGRRALALAAGAPREQSGAWRLIADALRARGRNVEAQDAAQRAEALAPP
ncbi:MAG: tetratricopeptide repeat protein [Steroidobacteraceae bacterium]